MIVPAGQPRDVRKAAAFVEALQGVLDEFRVTLEPPEPDDEDTLARFGLRPPEPEPVDEVQTRGGSGRTIGLPRPVAPRPPVEPVSIPFALGLRDDRSLVLGLVVEEAF